MYHPSIYFLRRLLFCPFIFGLDAGISNIIAGTYEEGSVGYNRKRDGCGIPDQLVVSHYLSSSFEVVIRENNKYAVLKDTSQLKIGLSCSFQTDLIWIWPWDSNLR